MNFPSKDLSTQHISQSYQTLLQTYDKYILDGLGNAIIDIGTTGSGVNPVSLLQSGQTSSMVVATASYAGTALFAEVAETASISIIAEIAINALTASYLDGFIESASFASHAESASYATNSATASYLLGSIESASFASQAATASYVNGYVKSTGDTVTGDLIGTDFIKTRSGTIIRDINGNIEEVQYSGGRTLSITRTGGYISSVTDGTRTWTYNRDINNQITDWSVTT